MSNHKLTVGGNSPINRTKPAAKIAAPPKGYTRIWIDVRSNVVKGNDGQVHLPDTDMERGLFARFGLRFETQADLEQLKERLQSGGENPFDYVTTSGDFRTPFSADGNYRIPVDVKNELYTKLSGRAAIVKQQIEAEEKQKTLTNNQNKLTAAKNGIDTANFQRSVLENKLAVNNTELVTTSVNSTSVDKNFLYQPGEVKLTLTSSKDLPLQDRIDGKILRQMLDPNYEYIWGDKFPEYVAEAKNKGLKPEVLSVSENGENTDVTIRLSERDITILRQINSEWLPRKARMDEANEYAKNYVNDAMGGFVQPVVNVIPNLYNGISEPFRAGEKLTFGTNYIPTMPRMEVAERSEYWNKDGRMLANKGAEITATIYFGGAVGSRVMLTQTGRILTGAEAGYNIGAGLAGKDMTQTDENGNYRQMSTLERGLRITGGVFGAKQTVNNELAAPNSAVNKLDDIFKNNLPKQQGELITPNGFKVKVNDNTFEDTTNIENRNTFEMRADKTLSGAKKAVNLPSWDKLTFKLEADGETIHLINNHTINGRGYQQSVAAGGEKDVFPANMSDKQIFRAIKEAYENSKKLGTQINDKTGEKIVELLGHSKDGLKIRIYVNVTTKQLDTAFPQ